MQMTGATAASLSPVAEKPLPEQIQQIETQISRASARLSGRLSNVKAVGFKANEGKTLENILVAQKAALKIAEENREKTKPAKKKKASAAHNQHVMNAENLTADIKILTWAIEFEKTTIRPLEADLQQKRVEFQVAEKARLEKDSAAKEEDKRRKEEADRLERDRQADLKRQDEIRQKEEEDRQTAEAAREVRVNESAPVIQGAYRIHKARKQLQQLKIARQQQDDLVRNFLGYLGGNPAPLSPNSREAQLVSWAASSYNVFSQPTPDYTFVKARTNAAQYEGLFDLVVSYRTHNPLDSHADNNWILIARDKIDPDSNLPAAVKLVRQCSAVLDGKEAEDNVSKAINDMMADTLATGGRIGIDLHRQATKAELEVMIPALRLSGQRAFTLAEDDVNAALEELARIYLDAAFKYENLAASPNRKAVYDEGRFNSHKAHCFVAATRGLGDIDDQLEAFSARLGKMGVSNVKTTRAGYDAFD